MTLTVETITSLTLFDPLFRLPLITGIFAAICLPMLGVLLHARREWLAALGLSHVSAAAQLMGMGLGFGLILTTGISSILALVVLLLLGKKGNISYALMILLGWSAVYVYASNHNMGEQLAHAMSDGQLLLVNHTQMWSMVILAMLYIVLMPTLRKNLIKLEFFPLEAALNGKNNKPILALFYVLTALLLTTATSSLGLMATFALLFVTPLMSFALTKSLSYSIGYSVLLGVLSYLIAIGISLQCDQPFGGMMVLILLLGLCVTTALGYLKQMGLKNKVQL